MKEQSAELQPDIERIQQVINDQRVGLSIRAVSFTSKVYKRPYYLIDYPYRDDLTPALNKIVEEEGVDLSAHIKDSLYIYFDYILTSEADKLFHDHPLTIKSYDVIHSGSTHIASIIEEKEKTLLKVGHLFAYGADEISEDNITRECYNYIAIWQKVLLQDFEGVIILFLEYASGYNRKEIQETVKYVKDNPMQLLEWRMWKDVNLVTRDLFLDKARDTATTAIMSRNLSHNIGSHVLPRSSLDDIANRLKIDDDGDESCQLSGVKEIGSLRRG